MTTPSNANSCSISQPVRLPIVSASGLSTAHSPTVSTTGPSTVSAMTAYGHRQPVPVVPRAGVARHVAVAGRLPSPLVPCPRLPPTSSSACIPVSSYISQQFVTAKPLIAPTKPVLASAAVNGAQSAQLPVYISPNCRPNVVPRPAGYMVPFYRPGGPQPGLNTRPGAYQPVGMFPNSANSSQQMPMPVGAFQPNLLPSCSQRNGLPVVQEYMSSVPPGVVPSCVPHNSAGGNIVPQNSASSAAVTSAVQPGIAMNGLSPLVSPDVCMTVSGMALNDGDFCLLQDAMKEEHAAFNVNRNMPADHVTSCLNSTSRVGETSSAESDGSLSDWSIIELPSPPIQHDANLANEIPGISSAGSSLMRFSLDSELSDSSNSACRGPVPFLAQKLSAASVPRPGSVVFLSFLCTGTLVHNVPDVFSSTIWLS